MGKSLETVQIDNFEVDGLVIRTINNEVLKEPIIPNLWKKFIDEEVFEKIPHKANSTFIYAVYTDYESDVHGHYTLLIGAKVQDSKNELPNNFEKRMVHEGKYVVFTALNQEKVFEAWMEIWNTPLDRAYTSDFECYDLTTGQVKIYIAVH